MNQTRHIVRLLVLILALAFLFVCVWLALWYLEQGGRWQSNTMNTRLREARKTVGMGNITDRNGKMLAWTDADGNRCYAADDSIRLALSHTVGDQMHMSGTGVETFHAGILLGFSGSIIDHTLQFLTGSTSQGDNIQLTVDAQLSAYIDSVFPKNTQGAVVVMNYKTGEILAMVSKPNYDPVRLATRQATADTTGSGYLNRCLQGRYTPGSVFKIVTLASMIQYMPDSINNNLHYICEGSKVFDNYPVNCYGNTVHGDVTLEQAFAKSCNVTFASIATTLGDKHLIETATRMGFNYNFSFRDIILYESSIPTSIPNRWELAWTGAGQGRLLVTPMHMAMIASAVANNGIMPSPILISQISGSSGLVKVRVSDGAYGQVMEPEAASIIKSFMRSVVKNGTGTRAAVKKLAVCGKTGSAETSNNKAIPTDAWFVGFLDNDRYPYTISIVLEKAGTGGSKAAPIAAKILKKAVTQDY